jgi:hypothetical protein
MIVDELFGGETGTYRVNTRDSQYVFDLDGGTGTVQRFAGAVSNRSPNDEARRLRFIRECRVGARGYWEMYPGFDDPAVEFMWQHTSEIRSIERIDDDADR